MNSTRTFDPWVGNQYARGFRVVILGESQADETEFPANNTDTITFVQKHAIECDPSLQFFTKVTKLILGYDREPDRGERGEFWHRVAFCNYLQRRLSRAREPTTLDMWREARDLFPLTLQELKPNFILVCSQGVCADLPPLPRAVKSVCINHPSAIGWSYMDWAPVVRKALTDAGAPRWPFDLEM